MREHRAEAFADAVEIALTGTRSPTIAPSLPPTAKLRLRSIELVRALGCCACLGMPREFRV